MVLIGPAQAHLWHCQLDPARQRRDKTHAPADKICSPQAAVALMVLEHQGRVVLKVPVCKECLDRFARFPNSDGFIQASEEEETVYFIHNS